MRASPVPALVLATAMAALPVAGCDDGPVRMAVAKESETTAIAKPAPRLTGGAPFVDTMDRHRKGLWKVSDGWRNGEWTVNDWRASQVAFDGALTLTLDRKQSKLAKFAGGEVQSRKVYGHGYYEVRMRAAPASGTVSGFFTYTGPPFGQPWDEIDVEILGAKPRQTLLTWFRNGDKVSHKHRLGFDATEGFHTYGFDWQPETIRWYIDGEMVHEATGEALPLPRVRQKLMVSLWGSRQLKSWVGPFDPDTLPTSMVVDCVAFSPSYAERQPCR